MKRTAIGLAVLVLVSSLAPAGAQETTLTLTEPYAMRQLTGPNILNRMEPGDVMRLGVFASRSEVPTTVVAVQGDRQVDIPFYRGPILDDLYDVMIPFEPTMVGPWTMAATRAGITATVEVPGIPALFDLPLLIEVAAENVDGRGVLSWTWPDLSEARAAGLVVGVSIMVTQEDNYDEYLLSFGLRDNPIIVGEAGERFTIPIPEGALEGGKLFLFRVLLQFYNVDNALVAESLTFAGKLYSPGG